MNSLLVVILERGQAQRLMERIRERGASGGSILLGRGTASSSILAALGLGDSKKEILISSLEDSVEKDVVAEVKSRKMKSAMMALLGDKVKSNMQMIEIICERGYADDIMAVARKAGAKGGTVVNARGTANEEDSKFFGTAIVPEKEILLIVAEKEIAATVLEKIRDMDILKKKGMGIVFTLPVEDFALLG